MITAAATNADILRVQSGTDATVQARLRSKLHCHSWSAPDHDGGVWRQQTGSDTSHAVHDAVHYGQEVIQIEVHGGLLQ